MGYEQATCSQLARMSALPVLHFSGAQFAVKELSDATALEVGYSCGLSLVWPAEYTRLYAFDQDEENMNARA